MQISVLKKRILDVVFVLAIVKMLSNVYATMRTDHYGFKFTEFLINYQGGFVRRGLLGEIFYHITNWLHIDIFVFIKGFSLICFVLITWFFVKKFREKHYALYLLPMCFFLGGEVMSGYFVRKDFLMILIFIGMVWVYMRKQWPATVRFLAINILGVFMLLSHEIFGFLCLPIFVLLLTREFSERRFFGALWRSCLFILPCIISFLLAIHFSGNKEVADTIWASWTILNKETVEQGAVGAIGWDTINTFIMHLMSNFLQVKDLMWSTVIWIITFPFIYYLSTNFLYAFRKKESDYTEKHRTVLSAIILFQFICFIPLFTILCNDYLRMCFLWVAGSFVVFLLIPLEILYGLIPAHLVRIIEKFNAWVSAMLPPSKTIVALLLLIIGLSPYNSDFGLFSTIQTSILYQAIALVSYPVSLIAPQIETLLMNLGLFK